MILTTRRLATSLLFIGLLAMATRVAVDSDTFWHLRAGAWMVEHRQVLTRDAFTHTLTGQAWQYPAWLSEVLMYGLYTLGGYGALALFTTFFVVLAFAFVYATCEGGVYLKAWVIILAATTSAVFWAARPHIITFALSAITLYVLDLFRNKNVNHLWLLPVLMILWNNVHPGFAIGFILIGLTFGGETLKALVAADRSAWSKPIWLAGCGLLCVGALFISPYGVSQLTFPFKTVSIGVLQSYIQEWQSPNFHTREAQVFIGLGLAVLGAVGFSRRRLDLTDFLLLAAFTTLALIAARNIATFALIAAPILARHSDSLISEMQERWPRLRALLTSAPQRPATQILNWALLILVAAAALIKIALPLNPQTIAQAIAASAPVGAANYLQTHPAPGKLFNSYNFGGYLTWALYPEYLIYVDGRTDLYGDEFLTEYLKAYQAGPGWPQTLAKYDIRIVLVETNAPIARQLARTPGWMVRYSDPLSVVLIKAP